jgi:hypothetical protein
MYFNGSTDYLTTPASTAFNFTGDWTFECWVYPTAITGYHTFLGQWGAPDNVFIWKMNSSGRMYLENLSTALTAASTTIVANQWQHIALTRSSNTIRMFVNGVLDATTATRSGTYYSSGAMRVGASGVNEPFNGYISNLRITKDLAVYTGAFTPPTSPLQTTQSAGTNIAAITTQTVLLLLQAAQAPTNNSFYDSANTGTQISYLGAPAQGTFSPFFQPYATYFPSGASIITGAGSIDKYQFSTGQFTIELWLYLLATPTSNVQIAGVQSTGGIALYIASNGTLSLNLNGTGDLLTSSYTPPLKTWVHLAISRNASNAIGIFAAGARINSTTNGGTYSGSTGFKVGGFGDCYIANVRVTKGSYLYDAGSASPYTVPPLTTPLATTAETVFLGCQWGAGPYDVSTYRNTLTVSAGVINQSISTTTFLTSPYSTSTNIGSVYFGGSDYLTTTSTTSSSVVSFGTNNFTVEFWMYLTKIGVNQAIFDTRFPDVANAGFDIQISNTNQVRASTNAAFYTSNLTGVIANQWYHVAVVRNINTMTLYLNGIINAISPGNLAGVNFVNTTATIANGAFGYFNGFISNLRAINGYAAYSYAGSFIPPLTPVTASLTGTTMLINGNNSAIYDSSGFHNIATTGTATITTSPIKFGSTSIKISPTAGLNITTSSNAQLQLGTGPFTIEAWIQGKSNAQQKVIFDNRNPDTANAGFDFYLNTSNVLLFGTNGTTYITGSTVLTNGLWYHVALVRESTTVIKMYLNGNQEGSTYTASATQNFTNYLTRIGFGINGTFDGFISDLRVTKYARYTANFTTATTYSPLM